MKEPLLTVRNLTVEIGGVALIDEVSLEIDAGESVGLVGESGAGKSTLARVLVRLLPLRRGEIRFAGVDLAASHGRRLRELRRELQIIFQDPLASLDPRMTIGATLREPLEIFAREWSRALQEARVAEMLGRVGLAAAMAARYPSELSGGQCQRVAIARAMMLEPKLLVCDEPVSALDLSIQGQIVNLLADLQRERGTALLLISHNLAVVRHLCERIVVLLAGRVLEVATREQLFGTPAHPYTRTLLAAVPTLEPGAPAPAALPNATRATTAAERRREGCVFASRCLHALPLCARSLPRLETVRDGQAVACHRWRELLTA